MRSRAAMVAALALTINSGVASAGVLIYNLRVLDSSASPSARIPQYYLADTAAELAGLGQEGDLAFAKDLELGYFHNGMTWASIGSTPTGTGYVHTTAGVQDAAADLVTLTAASDVAANQGTTVTVLHGNAAGQASFSAVVDADISSVATTKLTGTITDAQLANNYSGVGACGASTWASTLNDNAAPTCTQPGFSDLSGTAALAQITDDASSGRCLLSGGGGGDPAWATCPGPTTPTGTGYVHVTAGVQDGAADLVTLTSSTDVAANQGTTTTVLHGNASGQASFGAVAYADIQDLAGLSVMGRSASSSGVGANITGTAGQVLRVSSTPTLGFGSIDLASATAVGTSILGVANGGLGMDTTATPVNRVPVTTGPGFAMRAVPDCVDSGGNHLNFTTATSLFSCGTTSSGGAGSGNFLEVSVAVTDGYGSTTVTGQAWVTAASIILCSSFGTTADGLTADAAVLAQFGITVSDRSVATGFTLRVASAMQPTGTFRFHCSGV